MIDLYVSWPAVSQRDNFIRFWTGAGPSWGFLRGGVGRPPGLPPGMAAEEEGMVESSVEASPSLVLLRLRLLFMWPSSSNPSSSEAGGPTGTILDPNSTPMVTSWVGENRPSQSRIVSYMYHVRKERG